jgi:hypothetical protein
VEAEPLLITYGPQHTGGVINEAFAMKDTNEFAFKVLLSLEGINQLAEAVWIEMDGHSIDGEITPLQVILD